jgi:tRNA modification GTPase
LGSHAVLEKITKTTFTVQHAKHCNILNGEKLIDDVVATTWKAPHSYTGEDMVEISCHGNMLIVEQIIQLWIHQGARHASPGEFTQRAFLNGKMDLTQAEAVIDLIHAQSERALHAARRVQEGILGKNLMEYREELLQLLAHLEAYIDFPEEDIEPEVGAMFVQKIEAIQTKIETLLKSSEESKKIHEGMRVALVGIPNAGKSSLLNALLQEERAIVSDIPGTTRDTIEESIFLEGIKVRLIDTAGVRENPESIEKLGIERTHQAIEHADLVLLLIDGTSETDPFEVHLPDNKPVIHCITKSDLPKKYKGPGLPVSALKKTGLEELKQEIIKKLNLAEGPQSQELILINTRHQTHLEEAAQSITSALEAKKEGLPPELVSSDLRHALQSIGEIVGEVTNEDMLDRLFSTFCIGK